MCDVITPRLLKGSLPDVTAAKNHKHAVNNPHAQFQDGWTEEQVLNSPKVIQSLTKRMCTATSVRLPCGDRDTITLVNLDIALL